MVPSHNHVVVLLPTSCLGTVACPVAASLFDGDPQFADDFKSNEPFFSSDDELEDTDGA